LDEFDVDAHGSSLSWIKNREIFGLKTALKTQSMQRRFAVNEGFETTQPPWLHRTGVKLLCRIVTAFAEGVTSADALDCPPASVHGAVFVDCINRVLAARGLVAAMAAHELAERGAVE
jgi:hypothetical protein